MLLPLQGEGLYTLVPRALPWAGDWLPFQGARGDFELIEFLRLRDKRAALRGLKAQQVRSPGQRPGLTYVPHPRPVRAKAKNNRCAHAFALTGRGALHPGTQGVALGWELAALSGRSRRQLRGIAPERGSYSRIGACPYLPPQLINSRCCPCKGRISWAGLAPQYLSRYEPLTGARFINRPQEVGASPYPKYEPPSGALAPQVRDIRAALRGLKAQQVRSPGQRPGLTYVPHLRPVRAKAKNNRCAHAFALTGRRALCSGTQGVALGCGLAALSGRSRRGELIEFLQRG